MRSDVSLMALAAMAASASAQAATPGFNSINTPATDAVCVAGTTQNIAWSLGTERHENEDVCIELICGESQNGLVPEKTFADINGCHSPDSKRTLNSQGTYEWIIPRALPKYNMCGIKMYLKQNPTIMQYSGHFTVQTEAGPPTEGGQSGAASGVQPQVPGASSSQAAPLASASSALTSSAPAVTSAAALLNSTAPIATAVRNCAACGANGGSGDELTLSTETSTTLSTGGPATLATQTRAAGVANPTGRPSGSGPNTAARPSTPVTAGAPAVGAGISVLGGLAVAVLAL